MIFTSWFAPIRTRFGSEERKGPVEFINKGPGPGQYNSSDYDKVVSFNTYRAHARTHARTLTLFDKLHPQLFVHRRCAQPTAYERRPSFPSGAWTCGTKVGGCLVAARLVSAPTPTTSAAALGNKPCQFARLGILITWCITKWSKDEKNSIAYPSYYQGIFILVVVLLWPNMGLKTNLFISRHSCSLFTIFVLFACLCIFFFNHPPVARPGA